MESDDADFYSNDERKPGNGDDDLSESDDEFWNEVDDIDHATMLSMSPQKVPTQANLRNSVSPNSQLADGSFKASVQYQRSPRGTPTDYHHDRDLYGNTGGFDESEKIQRVRKARDVELANVRIVVKRKFKRKLEKYLDGVKANYDKELAKIRDDTDTVKLRLMQKELENDKMCRHIVQIEGLMVQWQHEYPATNYRLEKKSNSQSNWNFSSAQSKDLENAKYQAKKYLRDLKSQEEILLIQQNQNDEVVKRLEHIKEKNAAKIAQIRQNAADMEEAMRAKISDLQDSCDDKDKKFQHFQLKANEEITVKDEINKRQRNWIQHLKQELANAKGIIENPRLKAKATLKKDKIKAKAKSKAAGFNTSRNNEDSINTFGQKGGFSADASLERSQQQIGQQQMTSRLGSSTMDQQSSMPDMILRSDDNLRGRPRRLKAIGHTEYNRRSQPGSVLNKPWEPNQKPLLIKNCSIIENMILSRRKPYPKTPKRNNLTVDALCTTRNRSAKNFAFTTDHHADANIFSVEQDAPFY